MLLLLLPMVLILPPVVTIMMPITLFRDRDRDPSINIKTHRNIHMYTAGDQVQWGPDSASGKCWR